MSEGSGPSLRDYEGRLSAAEAMVEAHRAEIEKQGKQAEYTRTSWPKFATLLVAVAAVITTVVLAFTNSSSKGYIRDIVRGEENTKVLMDARIAAAEWKGWSEATFQHVKEVQKQFDTNMQREWRDNQTAQKDMLAAIEKRLQEELIAGDGKLKEMIANLEGPLDDLVKKQRADNTLAATLRAQILALERVVYGKGP